MLNSDWFLISATDKTASKKTARGKKGMLLRELIAQNLREKWRKSNPNEICETRNFKFFSAFFFVVVVARWITT